MKIILVLCVLLMGLLAGCHGEEPIEYDANGDQIVAPYNPLEANYHQGVVDNTDQRARRIDYIKNLNRRQIVDDWDAFWLNERSSHLTPYIARTGR